ncbi:hypothetical protein CONLIGDRAFT_317155 [Coniochaeta ligniaria NRRL 30616]|uniref:Uncharacterized protein n=1 Tax=Coniochaeta ligniaria NRRL 30616 TaxID=1408157 RepID=A0A1J7IW40_9PEZI|nr:hypothetical protein CONLIGDRAFT_317155 [Coniochaeta ligniaria NRRL 30616]
MSNEGDSTMDKPRNGGFWTRADHPPEASNTHPNPPYRLGKLNNDMNSTAGQWWYLDPPSRAADTHPYRHSRLNLVESTTGHMFDAFDFYSKLQDEMDSSMKAPVPPPKPSNTHVAPPGHMTRAGSTAVVPAKPANTNYKTPANQPPKTTSAPDLLMDDFESTVDGGRQHTGQPRYSSRPLPLSPSSAPEPGLGQPSPSGESDDVVYEERLASHLKTDVRDRVRTTLARFIADPHRQYLSESSQTLTPWHRQYRRTPQNEAEDLKMEVKRTMINGLASSLRSAPRRDGSPSSKQEEVAAKTLSYPQRLESLNAKVHNKYKPKGGTRSSFPPSESSLFRPVGQRIAGSEPSPGTTDGTVGPPQLTSSSADNLPLASPFAPLLAQVRVLDAQRAQRAQDNLANNANKQASAILVTGGPENRISIGHIGPLNQSLPAAQVLGLPLGEQNHLHRISTKSLDKERRPGAGSKERESAYHQEHAGPWPTNIILPPIWCHQPPSQDQDQSLTNMKTALSSKEASQSSREAAHCSTSDRSGSSTTADGRVTGVSEFSVDEYGRQIDLALRFRGRNSSSSNKRDIDGRVDTQRGDDRTPKQEGADKTTDFPDSSKQGQPSANTSANPSVIEPNIRPIYIEYESDSEDEASSSPSQDWYPNPHLNANSAYNYVDHATDRTISAAQPVSRKDGSSKYRLSTTSPSNTALAPIPTRTLGNDKTTVEETYLQHARLVHPALRAAYPEHFRELCVFYTTSASPLYTMGPERDGNDPLVIECLKERFKSWLAEKRAEGRLLKPVEGRDIFPLSSGVTDPHQRICTSRRTPRMNHPDPFQEAETILAKVYPGLAPAIRAYLTENRATLWEFVGYDDELLYDFEDWYDDRQRHSRRKPKVAETRNQRREEEKKENGSGSDEIEAANTILNTILIKAYPDLAPEIREYLSENKDTLWECVGHNDNPLGDIEDWCNDRQERNRQKAKAKAAETHDQRKEDEGKGKGSGSDELDDKIQELIDDYRRQMSMLAAQQNAALLPLLDAQGDGAKVDVPPGEVARVKEAVYVAAEKNAATERALARCFAEDYSLGHISGAQVDGTQDAGSRADGSRLHDPLADSWNRRAYQGPPHLEPGSVTTGYRGWFRDPKGANSMTSSGTSDGTNEGRLGPGIPYTIPYRSRCSDRRVSDPGTTHLGGSQADGSRVTLPRAGGSQSVAGGQKPYVQEMRSRFSNQTQSPTECRRPDCDAERLGQQDRQMLAMLDSARVHGADQIDGSGDATQSGEGSGRTSPHSEEGYDFVYREGAEDF